MSGHKKLKTNTSKDLLRLENGETCLPSLRLKKKCLSQSTYKLPVSSAFSQVKDFLPRMKAANDQLLQADPSSLDNINIENTNDCTEVIEMTLALVEAESTSSENENDDVLEETSSDTEDELKEDNLKLPSQLQPMSRTLVQEIKET